MALKRIADGKKHVIFSHHSLVNSFAQRGVSNKKCVLDLFTNKNVILSMNGHDHGDVMEVVDSIHFYTVNSASYMWAGVKISASEEFKRKYGYLQGILPFSEFHGTKNELSEKVNLTNEMRRCRLLK